MKKLKIITEGAEDEAKQRSKLIHVAEEHRGRQKDARFCEWYENQLADWLIDWLIDWLDYTLQYCMQTNKQTTWQHNTSWQFLISTTN